MYEPADRGPAMTRIARVLAAAALVAAIAAPARAQDRGPVQLVIAATTSVEDSGLFDHILPLFTARTGIAARVVSRGSATALMTAEHGTIDLVIVNDAEALDRFVAAGQGMRRSRIMHNQFVIVGPPSDPAGIKGMTSAAQALREIARQRATFVSRGDNSGTHVAEMRLWQAAKINPKARTGNWYRETGLGMGLTDQMAVRLNAYALTDRGTWRRAGTADWIMVDGDPQLFNPYEIIMVDPAKHSHVNAAAANAFIDWVLSEDGRNAIAGHRIDGEQLFVPDAGAVN
jgi:tungstate transport system substrate-binding protein